MATTTPVHAPVPLPRRYPGAASIRGAAVAAVGVSVPRRAVDNSEIEPRLGVAEGWIERRTGIRSRWIASDGESLTDCAADAALSALARAGVDGSDVDLVLVATTTADDVLPNAAPLVASAIGASRAGAFDVGAACTGFLSALAIGCGQIECRRAKSVVIVGVDFMSRITDPLDRGTAAVFADGAGAAVLVSSDEGRIGPIVLGSDAAGADHIHVRRSHPVIFMQGHETFRHAVARLSESAVEACAAAGVGIGEIDKFVFHQANGRILSAVGERLGLDPRRVIDCIADYGNTSAATLPLALDAAELAPDDLVLLGAFGAGFTWGATVVRWGADS